MGGTEPSKMLEILGKAGFVPYGSACGGGLRVLDAGLSGVDLRPLRGRLICAPACGVGGVEPVLAVGAASGAGGLGKDGAGGGGGTPLGISP